MFFYVHVALMIYVRYHSYHSASVQATMTSVLINSDHFYAITFKVSIGTAWDQKETGPGCYLVSSGMISGIKSLDVSRLFEILEFSRSHCA